MTSLKLLGAAALLSAAFATQAFAQAAIQEPGAFAFYHPNADVLNGGRSAPPASAFAYAPARDVAGLRLSVRPRHHAHHAAIKAH
ncbi:hypothetical protein [Bradyrhizobium sp. Tv2a-2]|uniref:hypothetical protein n=1 Tax=Bradyrhizobium sp. Tv2a-2 TaxID=113395 RepID=UPI0003FB7225|nr:hypothetical protein [Bradyrhizobium sp. Tv2a-2]